MGQASRDLDKENGSEEPRPGAPDVGSTNTSASQVRPKLPLPPRVPREALGRPREDSGKVALDKAALPPLHSGRIEIPANVVERSSPGRDHTPSLPPPLAKVGRYHVLGRVAVGGMAEIFLGREEIETGALRHVAVKILRRKRTEGAEDEAYFEEMFLREGRTASQLVHPNICHVYEFGKWGSDYFIAMEWIDGVALRNVLIRLGQRRELMPPAIAAGIAAQVAGALEYAHTARDARRRPLGVVHLDVNPQNIMLRHDGVVKLVDFGVAQVAESQGDSRNDMVKGKTGYLAPEQALQKTLDGRVDVFALGVCLYEMLSGRRLYHRETLRASLEALLRDPLPPLRKANPEVPEQLEQIVEKALARDPDARFQSAGELQAALEAYLARNREVVSNRTVAQLMETLFPGATTQGPALYTGPEVVDRLVPIAPHSEATSAEPLADVPAPSRSPARIKLFVALGALLLAVLVSWLVGSRPAPATLPAQAVSVEQAAPPSPSLPPPPPENVAPQVQEASERVTAPEPPSAVPSPTPPAPQRPVRRRASPGFVADPGF